MKKIRVTIWNEFIHERQQDEIGTLIRSFYPGGLHQTLTENLASDDLEIRTATMDEPEQGLPEDLLNTTDVLVWWGHCAHAKVNDSLVDRIQNRIQRGMGLIVLHSGHASKIFKRMMGTQCRLRWREAGEKERVWVVAPGHPIAQGIPETFVIPHTEMYGERFDIPTPKDLIFITWYEGGEVFRSGVTFERGYGRIFYFAPGHETYPIFFDPDIRRVIANAAKWAAPRIIREIPCPKVPPQEDIRTKLD